MTAATQAARVERKKWREHLYRHSVFGLHMKDRIQTILLSNIRINYDGFLSRGHEGELQGISSKYVFAASCMQAFKRRKVKANKLKSESINSCAIGKLCSVVKWAQTFWQLWAICTRVGWQALLYFKSLFGSWACTRRAASTKQLGAEVSYFAPLSQ